MWCSKGGKATDFHKWSMYTHTRVCELARNKIHDIIELIQNSAAMRIISNLKGRTDITSDAKHQLQLPFLKDRRKNPQLCFLMRILQNKDQLRKLTTAYGEIARDRQQLVTVTTSAAARGDPISIPTKRVFQHKFPAVNYLWDAWWRNLKQITIIKQQNSLTTIANPDPKIVKTRGFPKNKSCCGNSTSNEVNTAVNKLILQIICLKENQQQQSMEKWTSNLESNGERMRSVDIRKGILQRDSFSPLLFVICLIPMSVLLRRAEQRYSLNKNPKNKINHMLFMNDLNGKDKKELESLVETVRVSTEDVKTRFRL